MHNTLLALIEAVSANQVLQVDGLPGLSLLRA